MYAIDELKARLKFIFKIIKNNTDKCTFIDMISLIAKERRKLLATLIPKLFESSQQPNEMKTVWNELAIGWNNCNSLNKIKDMNFK